MTAIKEKLKQGLPVIGSWLQLPSVYVAEIIGQAGYDWAAIDLEHGLFPNDMLPQLFNALEKGDTVPFARVAQAHPKDIKHALDAGAKGLIFPMIFSGRELQDAVSWACYPPYGTRGVGYSHANKYGREFDKFVPDSSKELIIIAQIEHIRAVEALDEILIVDGLDGIIVGPYDLSASMNLTGKFDHPEFMKVIEEINNKAGEYKKPMGLHIVQPDPDLLCQKIDEGYQFIAYGVDAVFLYRSAECPDMRG